MPQQPKKKPAAVPRQPPLPMGDDVFDVEDPFADDATPAAVPPAAATPKPSPAAKATAVKVKRAARTAPGTNGATPPSRPTATAPNGQQLIVPPPRVIINIDSQHRELTKKQQSQLGPWRGETHGRQVDKYFAGQIAAARKQFGHRSVMAASAATNLVIGIPCPALAFEYLIAQDCFPLGLVMHLNGPTGTCKSALLDELFRWFALAGGGGHLLENETKHSPDLMPSIFHWTRMPVILDRCDSVEDWMQRLTFYLTDNKKKLVGTTNEPGPGRTIPILYGIDSIMGKASYETQEKVQEEGAASRQFPIEALKITTYMKTVPGMLDEWPFALVLNNHLKMGQDKEGHEVRRTAGGAGVGFQETFEIETGVWKRKIDCADWTGVGVRLQCVKNSLGPGFRRIETRFRWWEEQDEQSGQWRQHSIWDWDWSTVKMLTTLSGREAARLKDVFHIKATKISDVENAAWSATLGMKEKDAMPWDQLGKEIARSGPVLEAIRIALSIKRRPWLAGDYLSQTQAVAELLP